MASVNYYNYVDIDVDIDVEEFVDACSNKEIEELKHILGVNDKNVDTNKMSSMGLDYVNNVEKLSHLYYRLTQKEIDIINSIANKY